MFDQELCRRDGSIVERPARLNLEIFVVLANLKDEEEHSCNDADVRQNRNRLAEVELLHCHPRFACETVILSQAAYMDT